MKKHTCIVTDMDQVICKSQPIHGRLESEVLADYGHTISPDEIAKQFTGMGTENVFRHYLEQPFVEQALQKKESKLDLLSDEDILEIDGASEFYRKALSYYKIGLASGSSLNFIDLVIRSLKLSGVFEVIASGEEVPNGKPEPDVFLLALKRMGCNPQHCLIIEDGLSGIIAAKKIGATALGITTSYSYDKLNEAGADYIVDSFSEIMSLLEV